MGPGSDNLAKLLNTILNSFIDLCLCDGGSIFMLRKLPSGESELVFQSMLTRSIKLHQVPDHLRTLSFSIDDRTLVGRTAANRRSFRSRFDGADAETSPQVDRILNYVTRNILSAPLITPRGDLVGVVQLLNKIDAPEFDDHDERLFNIVAGQAALAIENSMLLEEQERLLEGFVNACVTAVEARDPVTSGHSFRVSDYTVALAEAVNRSDTGRLKTVRFSDVQLREIRYAAMLHDIGKISVKEDVLNKEKKLHSWELEVIRMRLKLMKAEARLQEKETGRSLAPVIQRLDAAWASISTANEPSVLPAAVSSIIDELRRLQFDSEGETLIALTGPEVVRLSIPKGSLTGEERLEIERHVSHTYEILKLVPWSKGLSDVAEIAWRHHEKLDGSGYPARVTAPAIPIQSRMLTIADIYDALTADDRPYKKAVPVDRALDILTSEVKGGKLDPELFQVFLEARVYQRSLEHARRMAA